MHRHSREIVIGAAFGLATLAVFATLEAEQQTMMTAILLGTLGAVYLGFAVADGRPSAIAVQALGATIFVSLAYVGLDAGNDVLLGVGWLAHAGWDMAHHEGRGPTRVATWYPPFCAVVDLLIGVPLVAGWV